MEAITLENKYYRYVMALKADGQLCHVMFVPKKTVSEKNPTDGMNAAEGALFSVNGPLKTENPFPYEVFVNLNFEGLTLPHGNRYAYTQATQRARFRGMKTDKLLNGTDHIITLEDPETKALFHLHYEIYDNSPALRRYTVIENRSEKELTVNHVSSFVLAGFPYDGETEDNMFLHRFTSAWCYEGEHKCSSFSELRIRRAGLTGYCASTTSGWVCQDHIPCFVLEQRACGLFTSVQIEHSSAWRFEVGNETGIDTDKFYMQGGMGNDVSASWNMELLPGASFRSPSASMCVSYGSLDDVLNLMHLHREKVLIHRNPPDRTMPVVFNDWMCLEGDVSEEAILNQLETLRGLGAEYYVTDAGWFTRKEGVNSDWNAALGNWEYDRERFPHGMKYLTDCIKRQGMKAGIWCEIESLGKSSPVYDRPDMLLMRENTFVSANGRRFLNFTSKAAREYADSVFRRIAEWGFEYIKIDYNADPAPGVSNAGSRYDGHGLHLNRAAYGEWLDGIRKRYPEIIIESCSSGGMRLEYDSLSRADLASLTDQFDYSLISRIAYNVTRLIHPSQCGIWMPGDRLGGSNENYAFALSSSMMGRMHLSGNLCDADEEKKQLVREAVRLYKEYRDMLPACKVYHHSGDVNYWEDEKPYALEIRGYEDERSAVMLKNFDRPEADKNPIVLSNLKSGIYTAKAFPGEIRIGGIEVKDGTLKLSDVLNTKKRTLTVYLKRCRN